MLDKFAQASPQVNLIRLDQNQGLPEALNIGIKRALEDPEVDFIARMDSDDISVKDRVVTQVEYLMENPTVDIVGSSVLMFQEKLQSFIGSKVIAYPTLDQLIKFNMLFSCCLAHPSLMFRAKSIGDKLRYGSDNPASKAMEDYDLWLRLIHDVQHPPTFSNIGSILLFLRKHAANKSSGTPIEAEVPLKVNYLVKHVKESLK